MLPTIRDNGSTFSDKFNDEYTHTYTHAITNHQKSQSQRVDENSLAQ